MQLISAIAAKMTNKMLLNRILPAIDPHLRPNQNGFRPGRTTAAHILALRRIIESAKKFNLKAILVFIDFKKAFDSIHRGKMLKILQAYGIPEKLVKAIAVLYENTKAKVLSPDGETETFSIQAEESSCMASLPQTDKGVEIIPKQKNQDTTVRSYSRDSTVIWKQHLVAHREAHEATRWHLHKNVKNGPKHLMAVPHHQRGTIRQSAESFRKDS